MDQIKIKNLEVFANHGVFPEENVLGQKFLISAVLYTDIRRSGITDNLSYSIHYGEVSQFINTFMKQHTYKLIEKVAESLAFELLQNTKYLDKVELEVKKPWAPVGLPVEYVSVSISRQWHTAYIALGSNMGNKQKYLDDAVQQLDNAIGCKVLTASSWLITAPYGMVEQDDFLNGCIKLKTLLTPEELLDLLHKIEQEAKRERKIHWGPRTLDLDILYYDEQVIESKSLCIPHPEIQKREFVLRPLFEIAPYKHHPISGKTTGEMLEALEC